MMNNLPVILLRGLVLLPFNDLKLEFENDDSRNVIDNALIFHDGKILVVTQDDASDINPNIDTLPHIGVVANISHKMLLPNGKVRVVITGMRRVIIDLYNKRDTLEASIIDSGEEAIDSLEEQAIIRKVSRELDIYIRNVPNIGNSVISKLSTIKKLDEFTDVLAPTLPITLDRLNSYLKELKASERARMILLDV